MSPLAQNSIAPDLSLTVADDPAASRYVLRADGVLAATAKYTLSPGKIELVFTELLPGFEGRGLGAHFAAAVLDDLRARHLAVVTHCVFFRTFIEDHPGYNDLVARPGLRIAAG